MFKISKNTLSSLSTAAAKTTNKLIRSYLLLWSLTLFVASLHRIPAVQSLTIISNVMSSPHVTGVTDQNNRYRTSSVLQKNTGDDDPDDRSFCTLNNFQQCISELWPGGSSSKITESTSASPSGGAVTKNSIKPNKSKQKQKSSKNNYHKNGKAKVEAEGEEEKDKVKTGIGAKSRGSDFPTTLVELLATCEDLKERVRCLDRHSERCFTPEMMQVFGHIVTNAKQFVHDLCDNKKVQSEFLNHAKCFRNISLDEQKCAQEYRDAINIPTGSGGGAAASSASSPFIAKAEKLVASNYEHQRNRRNPQPQQQHSQDFKLKELIMRRSCCALQELVLCKRRHVREQCGEYAAIFMRDHLPRITNPVLEQHCSAYTYGPGTCNEVLYHSQHGRLPDGQRNPFQNPFSHRASSSPSSKTAQADLGDDASTQRVAQNQQAASSGHRSNSFAQFLLFALQLLLIIVYFDIKELI